MAEFSAGSKEYHRVNALPAPFSENYVICFLLQHLSIFLVVDLGNANDTMGRWHFPGSNRFNVS